MLCKGCDQEKDTSEFPQTGKQKNRNKCKSCKAQAARDLRARKKQKLIDEGVLEAPEVLPEGQKRCIDCKDIKVNELFRADKKLASGYRNTCIDCANKKTRSRAPNIAKTTGSHECIKCKKKKPVKYFYKDKSRPDGLRDWCIECCKNYKTMRYKEEELPDNKECITCGDSHPLSSFAKNPSGRFYRANECNDCRNKKRRSLHYSRRNEGQKFCNGCATNKDVLHFSIDKNNKDGLQTYCKPCRLQQTYASTSVFKGFINNLFINLVKNAKHRGIEVGITKQAVVDLYESQCGRCVYTNRVMTVDNVPKGTGRLKNVNNISVDRIDSSKGYTSDNIQLVCTGINIIKSDLAQSEVYRMCRDISKVCLLKQYTDYDATKKQIIISNELRKFCYRLFTNLKHNAKKRDLIVDITIDDIINKYIEQGGRCVYTGACLTLNTEGDTQCNISVDRIDSTDNYTVDNIQLIANKLNIMKYDLEERCFIDLCKDFYAAVKRRLVHKSLDFINGDAESFKSLLLFYPTS
ncbi:hypothetical protein YASMINEVIRUS_126 [Yasminevirus sp. GU-2018]|uniref:Uncharacterized protein n=1 Tax=Yasminevirus sp. GU-2018 TaxID=2420051 RepID=A0A5K0U8K0_9VIRU|nr:hypothetical protein YASMINEVIRUS_126 [Yasminevirus sp. GU-2018]